MELTIQAVDELSIPTSRRHYALLSKCEVNMVEYHCSQFSLNGHLYKMDTAKMDTKSWSLPFFMSFS